MVNFLSPSFRPKTLHTNRLRRRGAAALICSMTAAAVFLSIAAVAVRTTLKARQERKTELDLHQAEFLLESGLIRASDKVKENKEYQGETWLDQQSPFDTEHWQVVIAVTPQPATTSDLPDAPAESDATGTRVKTVQVTARISKRLYSPETIQRTRTKTINLDSL